MTDAQNIAMSILKRGAAISRQIAQLHAGYDGADEATQVNTIAEMAALGLALAELFAMLIAAGMMSAMTERGVMPTARPTDEGSN